MSSIGVGRSNSIEGNIRGNVLLRHDFLHLAVELAAGI
jgi:hypothetical protein